MSEGLSRAEFARRAGCDEKQVRRAIEKGTLTLNAQGKLDAAQLQTAWRRAYQRNPDKLSERATREKPGKQVKSPARAPEQPPTSVGPAPGSMAQAILRKEDATGRLRELELAQKAGQLIPVETAKRVLFEAGRASRDHWANFVHRWAALIASDLGLEADKVTDVLLGYVHRHQAILADPDGSALAGSRG